MTLSFREYLNGRGITDKVIDDYCITGDEEKVAIPIDGGYKYRTFPNKSYFYEKGTKACLFGAQKITTNWCVLTEGELDALRLVSVGIPAVSGTGGAGTWNDEWRSLLPPLVFICYDTDKAGVENAEKVHHRISGSRIVTLPEGKDVTEYLKNHTKQDFEKLLTEAKTIPKPPPVFHYRSVVRKDGTDIERAKQYPIENLIKFQNKKAKCIWHNEKSPSLHLYPDNNVFCFGCGKGGDAIDVKMQLDSISFTEAVNILKL